jgi:uncharacterized delta-60 repeat protein
MRNPSYRPAILACFASAFLQRPDAAFAQPGSLDPAFAGFGSNAFTTGEFFYGDYATAVAPDGSVYACGSASNGDVVRAIVVHVQSNGLLDTDFGNQGFFRLGIGFEVRTHDMLITPDGGLVVAGYAQTDTSAYDGLLFKLTPDGTLDQTFGDGGRAFYSGPSDQRFFGVHRDQVGRLVAAGSTLTSNTPDALIVRFTANGQLDTGFGDAGAWVEGTFGETEELTAITGMPDGGYAAGGYSTQGPITAALLARVDVTGAAVPSFGGDGAVLPATPGYTSSVYELATKGDTIIACGNYFVSGNVRNMFVLQALPDGSLDPAYGNNNGVAVIDVNDAETARALAVQPDGKVLICGESGEAGFSAAQDFLLARLTTDGALDPTFGESGGYTLSEINGLGTWAFDLDLAPDGRIVVAGGLGTAGNLGFVVARYLNDGPFTAVPGTGPAGSGITLHPLPASSGPVHITSARPITSGTRATVLDALGRPVLDLHVPGVPAGGTAIMDLSQLSPGSYRLRVDGLVGSFALVIAR